MQVKLGYFTRSRRRADTQSQPMQYMDLRSGKWLEEKEVGPIAT